MRAAVWLAALGGAGLVLGGWAVFMAIPKDEGPVRVPPIAGLMASADPARGEAAAQRHCHRCHALEGPAADRIVAPPLRGVVGRGRASVPGFRYSRALQAMPGAWDDESLNAWLFKPSAFASGTRMSFPGLPDDRERSDVIAYLRVISGLPPVPPAPPAVQPPAKPPVQP